MTDTVSISCSSNPTLEDSTTNTNIVYVLGEAELSTSYSITQTPDCGYEETVSLDPLESWIDVDPNTNSINIEYLDSSYSSLIGVYEIVLTKSI